MLEGYNPFLKKTIGLLQINQRKDADVLKLKVLQLLKFA